MVGVCFHLVSAARPDSSRNFCCLATFSYSGTSLAVMLVIVETDWKKQVVTLHLFTDLLNSPVLRISVRSECKHCTSSCYREMCLEPRYQAAVLKHLFKVPKCALDHGERAVFLKKMRSLL